MKSNNFFILIFCCFLLLTCKTDFDVNGKWKDITVVYGVLNQNDSVHYIKVSKAYLGEGNAYKMARTQDSTEYKNGEIDVILEEYDNSNLRNSYKLTYTTVEKEQGIFGDSLNPKQVLYRTNALLNSNYLYQLKITNNKSGKIIKSNSKIGLIRAFTINEPQPTKARDSLCSFTNKQRFKWMSAKNGRAYQIALRFHYIEKDLNTGISTTKYVDLNFEKQTVNNLSGGNEMNYEFQGDMLYLILQSNIPVRSDVERKPAPIKSGGIEFSIYVAGDELNTYIDVNKPSNSVVQEVPEYTNIENGLGIFSSRLNNNDPKHKIVRVLNTISLDSLIFGRYTKKLNFKYP